MEWVGFSYAALIGLLVVYLPGVLVAKCCRFTLLASIVAAPAVTGFMYVAIGLLFAKASCPIDGFFLFVTSCVIALAALAASVAFSKWRRPDKGESGRKSIGKKGNRSNVTFLFGVLPATSNNCLILCLYVLLALIIAVLVFLGGIGSPDTFSREWDAAYHYSFIRSFLENGIFSILDARTFADIPESGSFYPALWHMTVAIVCDMTQQQLTVCANAVIFIALAFIFPIGVFGLLSQVFQDNKLVLVSGCVLPLAFTGFPWGNLIFGQIVSNFYSNTLLMCALFLFIVLIEALKTRECVARCTILLFFSLVALAGAQPNSVFTFGIFAVFYLMHFYCWTVDRSAKGAHKRIRKIAGCILIFMAACAVWALCFLIPLIQEISVWNELTRFSLRGAIVHGAFLSFSPDRLYPQIVLALICWVGFFGALFSRGFRWLCGPFSVSMFIFVVSASCLGPFCHAISGFWYNDVYRTCAMVCIFAIPLAALGFAVIIRAVVKVLSLFIKSEKSLKVVGIIVAVAVLAAFLPVNFLVTIPYSKSKGNNINAFQRVEQLFHEWYSWDSEYILNSERREFLKEVRQYLEENPGLVMNISADGSGWVYGIEGIDTMYRGWGSPKGSILDRPILRDRLFSYSSSEEVKKAVADSGLKYVLRLSPTDANSSPDFINRLYHPEDWKGVNGISDDTSGFEPVLKKGDMRLYKIVDE